MRRLFAAGPPLALVLALAGGGLAGSSQDDGVDDSRQVAAQIRDVVARLDALRSAAAASRAAHLDEIAALERQVERLEETAADSRELADEEEAEVVRLRQAAGDAEQERAALRERAAAWVGAVREPVARMLGRLSDGIAWRREDRNAQLEHLLTRLDDTSLLERLDAVSQVPAWVAAERNAARRVAVENTPVLLEDSARRVQAWRLRFGLVQEAFLSEDGREVGLGTRGAEAGWILDLTAARREALDHALQVLQEREAPEVIALPLPRARSHER